ncbi:MAG: hypothetical protein WKF31_04855 [Thermoleophilaceae bacterium]
MKPDMFSITPAISRSKRRASSEARWATFWAAGCGVVTMTMRALGMSWARVMDTSPVPGGRSSTRKSTSPHSTSSRNCLIALWSIGPRQTMPWSWVSRKNSMDMTFTPAAASSGLILRSAFTVGRPCTPSMRGME